MYVYGACLFFMSVVVVVWGSVGKFRCVAADVKDSGILSLGVLKYVVCFVRGVMDVVFSVCIVVRGAVSARVCIGSMSVFVMQMCRLVSCVHPVAILNAAFCMTCSLLMLVKGCKRQPYERDTLQSRSQDCLIGSHECFLPTCYCDCFYHM